MYAINHAATALILKKKEPGAPIWPLLISTQIAEVLWVIFHEKDILLSPFSDKPAWGLGIISFPIWNFILEFMYGIFCWWYFKGNKSLLITIVIFNILDLPVMLASGKSLDLFISYPFLLPTFILFQILITWFFVAKFSGKEKQPLSAGHLSHALPNADR